MGTLLQTDLSPVSFDTRIRAARYNEAFPDRPPLAANEDWVTGTWAIGSCYKNPARMPDGSPFYGGYPYGYLQRVHSMFPEARNILHAFSGGLTVDAARQACDLQTQNSIPFQRPVIELVDLKGSEDGRHPTWQGNLLDMPEEWNSRFDLVLADPPYSAEDAKKYDCPPPNRGKIMSSLRYVAQEGANLVWLDTCWPMHRKTEWKTWGHIGLVRSTNHRMRLVSLFKAV